MQKHSPQFSIPLIIFALINVLIFLRILIYCDYLPITEASLLTPLYQPRQTHIGGSR